MQFKLAEQFNLDIPVAKKALTQLQDHQQHGFAESDLATVIQQVEHKTVEKIVDTIYIENRVNLKQGALR